MLSTLGLLLAQPIPMAWGQIQVDDTLGTAIFTSDGDATPQSLQIRGGTIRGANLFHSFQQFNVAEGQQVYFANPVGIEQILTRVTGQNSGGDLLRDRSQILGTLGVDGPANLFLLNPSGIVLGPNAQLDIQGSFAATTADRISFSDGSAFLATSTPASLLTVSTPLGLQLGRSTPQGDLINQANLVIPAGQTLTFLGNTLVNQGVLQASAGQVALLGNQVEIFDPSLEGLSGRTSLTVEANQGIVLRDAMDDALDFAPGNGSVQFIADADGDGIGTFTMDASDTLRTLGRDLFISGASLRLGGVDTSATPRSEAGELLATAQMIDPTPGAALTQIVGQLTTPTDIDLYQIVLSGNETFSASTVGNSLINTQLFLFDGNGQGIYGNDNDANCGCQQSTLTATQPLPAGTYFLGVTTYGTEPSSQAGAIFPNGFDTLDFSALETPTGVGGNLPLQDWNRQPVGEVGGYGIALTGVVGSANSGVETPLLDSGSLTLIANSGDLEAGPLTTAGTASGGEIRLEAIAGNILLNQAVNALGVQGDGGDISIEAGGNVTFQPQTFLFTDGQLAGDLNLSSGGEIQVQNGLLSLRSAIDLDDQRGGSFEIQGRSLSLLDGAQIIAETDGRASLNDSRVTVQTDVVLGGTGTVNLFSPFAFLGTQVGTPGRGDGGDLTVEAGGQIRVTNAAFLGTRSFGRGNAGDLTLRADEVIVRDALPVEEEFLFEGSESIFESELGTEAELESEELILQGGLNNNFSRPFELNEANAGDLLIESRRLLVQDGGEVSAGTHSLGNGGNLTVIADEVIVTGQTFGENSELATETVPEFLGARPPEGNAGSLRIESDRLQVTDGGQISTATLALGGNAGRLQINAREIEVGGGFVTPEGEVKTGSIVSEVLSAAAEGAQGDATQAFGGAGGTIEITTDQLTVRDGGRISVSTDGNGPAGDLFLQAQSVELAGEFIPDGNPERSVASSILASSNVAGQAAGNLQLTIEQLQLRDRAILAATTQGNQGNLTVTGGTVLLANGGQITTNAGGDSTGGNITLDLDNLIATPALGNNDITANAENGSGGQIRIRTRSPILGFQTVAGETFLNIGETPGDRPSNDITAFSQFNPAIDNGSVIIDPPELDPASSLSELPSTVIDPSNQIIAGCPTPSGNRFVVTRQGGLPPDPRRGLRRQVVSRDLRLGPSSVVARRPNRPAPQSSRPALMEAQTWRKSNDGQVILMASQPQKIASASTVTPTHCPR